MEKHAMDTKAILDHQIAAFATGDADDLITDFAEDAALIMAEGVTKGSEAIHAAYADMFSELFKPGTYTLTIDALNVDGDVGQIVWRASCASVEIPLGSDTFVVRNGKIVTQTFAAKIDPK
jgi:uncharacterized protein (TIGR02246 family)